MLAQQYVEGMLDCRYCNLRIMPVCVPDWVTEAILLPESDPRHISLPLAPVITNGQYTLQLIDLPPEATVGVEADSYCSNDAQQAQDVANAAANAKAAGVSADCLYANDAVFVCCAGVDPFTHAVLEAGVLHMLTNPDTGEPYIFYTMYSPGSCLAFDYSRPSSASEYLTAPAGMFMLPGADMKDECNRRAIEFAMSALTCVWTNPVTQGICTAEDYARSLCETSWVIGKGLPAWSGQLVDWSNTSARPVHIARGYVMYVGTGGDEETAFEYIWGAMHTFGDSMIMCIYTNAIYVYTCDDLPDGPTGQYLIDHDGGPEEDFEKWTWRYINNGSLGTIGPNTVYAESPYEANALAAVLAQSMAACDINTVTVMKFPEIEVEVPPVPKPYEESSPESSEEGGGGGQSQPSPTPSPQKPEPSKPDKCCYTDCPQFSQASNPISLNLTEIDEIITNVHNIIQRLDDKATALNTRAAEAIQKANG